MAALIATMEAKGASSMETKKVIPSCYTKKYDHMLLGMAMGREGPSLDAYA